MSEKVAAPVLCACESCKAEGGGPAKVHKGFHRTCRNEATTEVVVPTLNLDTLRYEPKTLLYCTPCADEWHRQEARKEGA